MAIKPVNTQFQKPVEGSSSGSSIGGILGAIGAAAATIATAGAAAPLTVGGLVAATGGGIGVGQFAGGIIKPGSEGGTQTVDNGVAVRETADTPIARRFSETRGQAMTPSSQIESAIQDSIQASKAMPAPVQDAVVPPLAEAYMKALKQRGSRTGGLA